MTNFSCLCKIDKPHRGLVHFPLGNLGNGEQVRTLRNIGKNTFFGGSGSLMAGSSVTGKKGDFISFLKQKSRSTQSTYQRKAHSMNFVCILLSIDIIQTTYIFTGRLTYKPSLTTQPWYRKLQASQVHIHHNQTLSLLPREL